MESSKELTSENVKIRLTEKTNYGNTAHLFKNFNKLKEEQEKIKEELRSLKKSLAPQKLVPVKAKNIVNQPDEDKLTRVKKAWYKFILNSSIYGLSRTLKTNSRFIQFIWILMILISTSYGFKIVYDTLKDFLRYDVITQTKRVWPALPVFFPAITFCFKTPTYTKVYLSFISNFNGIPLNLTADFENFYYRIDEKIPVVCKRYNGYWNNATRIKQINLRSELLYVNIKQNTTAINLSQETPTFVYIYITDNFLKDYKSATPIEFNHIGDHYSIYFNKKVEKLLESPYNPCQSQTSGTYRKANCLNDCLNSLTNNTCDPPVRAGFDLNWTECEMMYQEYERDCGAKCVKECDSIRFEKSVVKLGDGNDEMRIRFAYEELNYLELSQIPKMNWASLVSSLGGTFSVFLSLKLLSLVEFLEFFIEIFSILTYDCFTS